MNQNNESLLYKDPFQQNPVFKKYSRIIFGLCILCISGVVLVFAYVYYISSGTTDIPRTDSQVSIEERAQQAGRDVYALYMSESAPTLSTTTEGSPQLLEKNTNSQMPQGTLFVSGNKKSDQRPITQIYSVDIQSDTETFTSLFPDASTAMIEFKDVKNPKESFVLTTSAYTYERDIDKMSIHKLDVLSKELQAYLSILGSAERSLDWSATSNLLAFNRLTKNQESYADLISLANWEIVIFDPATDQILTTVAGGYQPKWSPDGKKILYLKEDGLYVYNLDTKTETQLIAIREGGKVTGTSMIDLSPNGKYLVWTTAKAGVITVKEIVNWDTVALKDVGQMKVSGAEFFWPQFSPDSSYYVVQAIDARVGNDQERKNPRLEIRAFNAKEVVKSIPLTEFNFDAFFTDDWVAKIPGQ